MLASYFLMTNPCSLSKPSGLDTCTAEREIAAEPQSNHRIDPSQHTLRVREEESFLTEAAR